MFRDSVINPLFLLLFNVVFLIVGVFLNSVVIVSIWRSFQLRKKLCYFMILVLSCVDLAGVVIIHPLQISSTVLAFLGKYDNMQEDIRIHMLIALNGSSLFALFVLNIERFLALTYPFFHQASVTKWRLIRLLATLMIAPIIQLGLFFFNLKILVNLVVTIVFQFCCYHPSTSTTKCVPSQDQSARSKRKIEATVNASRDHDERRPKLQFKKFSTCFLAVISYLICACPNIVFSTLRLTLYKNTPFHELIFYQIWASTFLTMNSTFNCVIFFWRNSILRREGVDIIKSLRC